MRLFFLALCSALLTNYGAQSQTDTLANQTLASPYNFNWKKDLIASSMGGALLVGGIVVSNQLSPLTAAQLNSLDPFNIMALTVRLPIIGALHRPQQVMCCFIHLSYYLVFSCSINE